MTTRIPEETHLRAKGTDPHPEFDLLEVVCPVCGYGVTPDDVPERCPKCGHGMMQAGPHRPMRRPLVL